MKKIELLAPAGNMESLYAAISAGADAVYLSGKKYGARAFAANFSDDELVEAINYSHLYDVKVYVTVNTLIYESEMDDFIKYIEFLYRSGVDAVIMQDLGAMDLVRQRFPKLEIHASTQMNIHSLESVKLLERLGIKRAVLSRELSINDIFNIKKNSDIELEIFIQGALCVSFSGCCLMSSLIGGRSGNRGSCAQCCRMKYALVRDNKVVDNGYLLSTKDLCTVYDIDKLIDIGVSSLKIEGRMKRPEYVYVAVRLYRKAIDSYINNGKININDNDILELKKIFNREFTKGFLFNESNENFINKLRPNHGGVEIGKVVSINDNCFYLKLSDNLNVQDGIRIINDDIGFTVTEMFVNDKKVSSACSGDIVKIKKKINSLGIVVKTTDYLQLKDIKNKIKISKTLPLNINIVGRIGSPLSIEVNYKDYSVKGYSEYIIEKSIKSTTTREEIIKRISRLNDTVYSVGSININIDNNIFIPGGVINRLKRDVVDKLNLKRLKICDIVVGDYGVNLKNYNVVNKKSVLIDSTSNISGYNEVYNIKDIDGTTLRMDRVVINHSDINKRVLVSELGSINKYKDVVTDFGLNVVNSYTVAFLHSLGVDKITLSYELDYKQIKEIIDNYHKRYNKHPNLEVIVSSYPEVMVCKYKLYGDYLKDRFNNLFRIKINNDYMYIYHYKEIKSLDDFYKIGVNWIRNNRELYEDTNI